MRIRPAKVVFFAVTLAPFCSAGAITVTVTLVSDPISVYASVGTQTCMSTTTGSCSESDGEVTATSSAGPDGVSVSASGDEQEPNATAEASASSDATYSVLIAGASGQGEAMLAFGFDASDDTGPYPSGGAAGSISIRFGEAGVTCPGCFLVGPDLVTPFYYGSPFALTIDASADDLASGLEYAYSTLEVDFMDVTVLAPEPSCMLLVPVGFAIVLLWRLRHS